MVADFDNKPYQPALQNQSQVSSNYDETLADKCPKAPVTHGSVVIPIFEGISFAALSPTFDMHSPRWIEVI